MVSIEPEKQYNVWKHPSGAAPKALCPHYPHFGDSSPRWSNINVINWNNFGIYLSRWQPLLCQLEWARARSRRDASAAAPAPVPIPGKLTMCIGPAAPPPRWGMSPCRIGSAAVCHHCAPGRPGHWPGSRWPACRLNAAHACSSGGAECPWSGESIQLWLIQNG